MSDHQLADAARRENALTLGAVLGVDSHTAAEFLDANICVTVDHEDVIGLALAIDVVALLKRTVRAASLSDETGDASVEIVIGAARPKLRAAQVHIVVRRDSVVLSRFQITNPVCEDVHLVLVRLAACYVAAAAIESVLGENAFTKMPDPLILRFRELGIDVNQLSRPVELGHAYLAGAGAIGNGLLWAAEHIDLSGVLTIADDDTVEDRNLNRQILFQPDDIGKAKAHALAARAGPLNPNLELRPKRARLQNLSDKNDGPWLSRLIVAVDSRRARRELQREMPGEVFDASTTDVREVVLHYNRQPNQHACLSCIYVPDEAEYSREQHIADALGVTADDVRTERITRGCAIQICARYSQLTMQSVEGIAYDTLFKRLCAETILRTGEGRTVLAPFAFVSCLAGTLLLLEIVRRLAVGPNSLPDNYWRVSAWHPPIARARLLRPREASCEFCGESILTDVVASLWGSTPV